MLTLYLLRHAKSSWADESMRDFDRPLANRGREACAVIGELGDYARVATEGHPYSCSQPSHIK